MRVTLVPLVFAFVVSVCCGPARAQANGADDHKLKVLVLDPTSSTVEPAVLTTVGSLLSVELAKIKQLDVITSSDVKKIAALEADKQSVGCEESSCLAELAGAMGARLVIFGDANKLGSLTVLNLNLFDSQKAQSVGRTSIQAKTVEELPGLLAPAVRELVRDALKGEHVDVAAAAPAPAPPPTNGGSALATLWTWGLVGGGAVVGLGGLAYDAVAPSSGDGHLNGLDFIGPTFMTVGAVAIVVGLVVNPFTQGGGDA